MTRNTNLARLLLDRFRWFDEGLRRVLNERLDVDVTPAQSLLFAELPNQGARQSDLARGLGVSRQAINELVRGLERQGLVEMVPDPDSARSKLVRPTAQGRKSTAVALDTFSELEALLKDRIGNTRIDSLRLALEADWGPIATSPPGDRT